jgi:hypothetical protein
MQVRPSDLDKYNLPAQCRLPLTDHDKKMGQELLKARIITTCITLDCIS